MQLATIFEALTYGELKQLSIGGADEDGIYPKHSDEVLAHLNMAMVSLYSKFPLQERELILRTNINQTKYLLTSANAISQDPSGYIVDTVDDPFTDDILRINAVFDQMGHEVSINDEHTFNSIFLPTYNTVQIPYTTGLEDYYFIYRVKPPKVEVPSGSTPSDVEVAIPEILLEPLLTYISARAHNARGGDKGKQEGAFAMQQYEQMCKELEVRNVFNNSLTNGNRKVELNGWA